MDRRPTLLQTGLAQALPIAPPKEEDDYRRKDRVLCVATAELLPSMFKVLGPIPASQRQYPKSEDSSTSSLMGSWTRNAEKGSSKMVLNLWVVTPSTNL